jgi:predicted ATPase/class 3 adenylate cyclase
MSRSSLPTGTVTLLFTDIEASTELLAALGAPAYAEALATHRQSIRDACARHGGIEVDTQGDAFFVAFAAAARALEAAAEAQVALARGSMAVRMGLHTGTPHVTTDGYVGADVHLAARIAAAAWGGQVVMSRATVDAARGAPQVPMTDLGEHRVKGFRDPVWIYQLGTNTFPPLRTISNTNLPRPASTFVGREHELGEISALLVGGSRLVTLTGPGGTGKTRLAIEVAGGVLSEFGAGAFWVALAEVRDPGLVGQTIGEVIGARASLAESIGERKMLLLLDNLEQVVAAAEELGQLLKACANLHMLVTSRELLGIDGEREYAVPPLDIEAAVALFVDRAAKQELESVAELCRRLEGLPLAIELAAARTRVMSADQILERLSQRLDLLKGGRDIVARQQTLRATIKWSYDLLGRDEQGLLARMSVFAGGATLEAAEAVVEADIDLLQSLVEKSLIRRVGDRFRMLETIREFAVEQLAKQPRAGLLHLRHAEFYAELADQAESEITGPGQQAWWRRLTEEESNFRAALAWSSGDGGDPAVALRLSGLLWRYWWQRGQYREGRSWYEAALAAGSAEPEQLRAQARYGLAAMLTGMGKLDEAIPVYEQCLALFRREGDDLRTMATLTDMGIIMTQTHSPAARGYFEESLAISRSIGDQRRAGIALLNLAELAIHAGDLTRALALQEEALAALISAGDEQSAANLLGNRAQIELQRGQPLVAARSLAESLSRSRRTDDRYTLAHTLVTAAAVAIATHRHELAAALLGRAEGLREEMGLSLGVGEIELSAQTLGQLRTALGPDLDAALAAGAAMDHDAAIEMAIAALSVVDFD